VQANPGKVVTKYTFSTLLNEALAKTMIPAIMISGFKRSGIYLFSPEALDYGMSNDVGKKSTEINDDSTSKKSAVQFSADQEKNLNGGMKKDIIFLIHFISSGLK